MLGGLTTGGIVLGSVAVKAIETKLDLDDLKRGENREVAFVHEVSKLKD